MKRRLLRALALIVLSAPVVARSEYESYFSLSTSRTFGSRDQPLIQLSGYNVGAVQIRAYRINDPIEFFSRIEDPHGFGATYPRYSSHRTLIERIRDWKSSMRYDIRHFLRDQFTESPVQHFKSREPANGKPRTRATYFAEAPVLNSQQVVLSFIQPLNAGVGWRGQEVKIPLRDKGLFLIEAVHHDLRAFTIVTVSDMVLITKYGGHKVFGFTADRYTGQPISGADFSTVRHSGASESTKTDPDGIAELTGPKTTEDQVRLVAAHEKDIAYGEVPQYSFFSDAWTGYIYTDRPVYRPGDTMHFRGILRVKGVTGYQIPAGESVSVQINDPDGKSVYSRTVSTSQTGVIHDELDLQKHAGLGNYSITVKAAGSAEIYANFQVQEYKKPEYDVRVTPDKKRVLEGDAVETTIDTRYYFGEPVASAKVKYTINRSQYWSYPANSDESDSEFSPRNDYFEQNANQQIDAGEGVLDGDGRMTVRFSTTLADKKIDYRYLIVAEVVDKGGRSISGSGGILATYGSFRVSAEPENYFSTPGSSAAFNVSALDYDNNPVATSVHVELLPWDWREHKVSETVAAAGDAPTGSQGKGRAQLTLPNLSGSYRVRARAKTPEGRVVESESYLWISGGEDNFFSGTNPRSVEIVPDKKSYRPGDTAHVLVIAGRPNTPVLVTVEGRDVRSHKLIRSPGNTALFEYKVALEDEPSFFVTAQFMRDGELFSGTKRVKAPPEEHRLNIALTTDQPQYLPGQTATYTIQATTSEGKALPRTDLSLGVVDEAVYAIAPDDSPEMVKFFFGAEWNSVNTSTSLDYYFSGEAGRRRMQLAQLRPPSTLAQLKPERLVAPKIRKAFPDTTFWAADITTDSAGRAQTKVTFPDSLTTWRATARGASPDERYGSGVLKTIVRKNLIVRLALPRFFIQGDEAVISEIVHNYLSTAKKAHVVLKLQGLEVLNGALTQEVDVASRGEAKIDWRVKALVTTRSTITGEALTDEESDALEMSLPIHPPGIPVRQGRSGSIGGSGSNSVNVTFPENAVAASRSVTVRLNSSIAGSIFNALEYLTSFPYGCVEQTMSSFLPDLMVSKAANELKLQQTVDQDALRDKLHTGLERLYGFQHPDGGWGWWQSDETHPFMTAYVVAGLAEARNDGLAVNDPALRRGVARINRALVSDQELAPDLRAYMAYALVMAGQPGQNVLDAVYRDRSKLSSYGMALLGLAFEFAKDGRAGEMAAALEASAKQNDAEAWWPATRDEMLDFEADVTPESTAYVMKLLSHQRAASSLLPKAALWLVDHRNEGYWWASTKQTAMVIYGLLDYLKISNELHPNLTATVVVNGQAVLSRSFTDAASAGGDITIDESKLGTANTIQVTTQGSGRLYYSVSGEHYSNEARLEKQAAISLNVLRDYFRLIPARASGEIVYDLEPFSGTAAVGDTIAVRVTVTGSDWKYLLLEDPIPAGTEFYEQDRLLKLRERPPWWRYYFTRREMHDDRMAIFQTSFSEGQQQYFYTLKVTNAGMFHVGPARVGPMYQPQIQATTEARTLEVR